MGHQHVWYYVNNMFWLQNKDIFDLDSIRNSVLDVGWVICSLYYLDTYKREYILLRGYKGESQRRRFCQSPASPQEEVIWKCLINFIPPAFKKRNRGDRSRNVLITPFASSDWECLPLSLTSPCLITTNLENRPWPCWISTSFLTLAVILTLHFSPVESRRKQGDNRVDGGV